MRKITINGPLYLVVGSDFTSTWQVKSEWEFSIQQLLDFSASAGSLIQ